MPHSALLMRRFLALSLLVGSVLAPIRGQTLAPDPYADVPASFGWAGTTRAELERLVGAPVRWLETGHFRIGSTLPEVSLGATGRRVRAVRRELDAMRAANPKIPRRVAKLDPWLRVHLTGHRLEALYGDFLDHLDVDQNVFPAADATLGNDFGMGPHLGRKGRFCVLMLATEAQLARVRAGFLDAPGVAPVRHHDPVDDSLGHYTSAEAWGGVAASDEGMAADVTFHAVLNFVDGWRRVQVGGTPWWLREGLAHWFQMRVTDQFHYFGEYSSDQEMYLQSSDWRTRAVEMARSNTLPGWGERASWHDPALLTARHHIVAWASVDHLVCRRPGALRVLLDEFDVRPFDALAPGSIEAKRRHREVLEGALGEELEDWSVDERAFLLRLGRRSR